MGNMGNIFAAKQKMEQKIFRLDKKKNFTLTKKNLATGICSNFHFPNKNLAGTSQE